MPAHRPERVAEAIREVVASAILFEMADPRVKGITVTRVEAAGDLRNATVHVSIMGTESQQKQALGALRHGAGFLQSKVAARLQTRFTPVLAFKKDDSIKRSIAISKLIDQVSAEREATAGTTHDDLTRDDEPVPSPEDEDESENDEDDEADEQDEDRDDG